MPDGCEANASAVALSQRAGLDSPDGLQDLPDTHPVWQQAAHYLAGVCVSIILVASAEKIVLGGGVLNRKCLFPMIREEVKRVMNGYLQVDAVLSDIDSFIVPAIHGNNAGIIGALALAQTAVMDSETSRALATPAPQAHLATETGGTSFVASALIGVMAALAVHKLLPKL